MRCSVSLSSTEDGEGIAYSLRLPIMRVALGFLMVLFLTLSLLEAYNKVLKTVSKLNSLLSLYSVYTTIYCEIKKGVLLCLDHLDRILRTNVSVRL